MKEKNHKRITKFKPKSFVLYENIDTKFSAGREYEFNFNSYLKNDVEDYFNDGDGVTYIITNNDEIVSYFSISSYAIPYHYIIDDEDELWSISAVELKMFAVAEKYQDTFFKYEDTDIPISAWCLKYIIDFVQRTIGCKAIYLHPIPEAENFYRINGFKSLNEKIMLQIHGIDNNFSPLWLPLQKVNFGDE